MKVKLLLGLAFFCLAVMAVFISCERREEGAFPRHAVEFMLPVGPGGGMDALVRAMEAGLARELGVPIRVNHLPGGAHTVGILHAHAQPADGHLFFTVSQTPIMADVFNRLPFRFMDEFVPIARIQAETGVFWTSTTGRFGGSSIQDVIEFARANPGNVTVAVSSPGGIDDAAVNSFGLAADVQFAIVPIDSGGERLAAVIGGHVDLLYEEASAVGDLAEGGAVRGCRKSLFFWENYFLNFSKNDLFT